MANREGILSIQYSLRKLIEGGLVERSSSGRSGVSYTVTPLGHGLDELAILTAARAEVGRARRARLIPA